MTEGEVPDFSLVDILRIPQVRTSPWSALFRRVLLAVILLIATAVIVYAGRAGYRDADGDELTFLDAFYYSAVSLSTTGYGDITPISPTARLVNVAVITPMRVLFLIILVGTTLSVLTERSRQTFKIQRWRRRVRNHTVVVGYGTKGRAAVDAMVGDGAKLSDIVVVDTDAGALRAAANRGLVTVHGSATKSDILRLAGVATAASVVVAANRDDTAVLVTLSVRELNSTAPIAVAIREVENIHLLRQSGASSVVVSSETAGRLLGIATTTPTVVEMMEDLLTPEEGFAIAERAIRDSEIGSAPRDLELIALGVVRDGRLVRVGDPVVGPLRAGDRLLYIRHVAH